MEQEQRLAQCLPRTTHTHTPKKRRNKGQLKAKLDHDPTSTLFYLYVGEVPERGHPLSKGIKVVSLRLMIGKMDCASK
jgi:hypothetical protein